MPQASEFMRIVDACGPPRESISVGHPRVNKHIALERFVFPMRYNGGKTSISKASGEKYNFSLKADDPDLSVLVGPAALSK